MASATVPLAPVPLTTSGWIITIGSALSLVVGRRLGWDQLVVLATVGATALALATGFVVGRVEVSVQRTLPRRRVRVGDAATVALHVTSREHRPRSTARFAGGVVDDRGGARVDLAGLGPGATRSAEHRLDTSRRGRYRIGPAVATKADPLGLLRRDVPHARAEEFWVFPPMVPLEPIPAGLVRDLEGPTGDTAPAGDVSFHALRDYEIGDDHRHVHWLSSARTGTLMVRHHVDNRQPSLLVVLDPDRDLNDEAFELGVAVAASVVGAATQAGQPWALRLGIDAITGDAMEVLALAQPGSSTTPLRAAPPVRAARTPGTLAQTVAQHPDASVVVLVTGSARSGDVSSLVSGHRVRRSIIVVRCLPSDTHAVPGTTTIAATGLDQFATAWNQAMRCHPPR